MSEPYIINSDTSCPVHPKIGLDKHLNELKFNGLPYSITVETSLEIGLSESFKIMSHVFSAELILSVNVLYPVFSRAILSYTNAELLKTTDHICLSILL